MAWFSPVVDHMAGAMAGMDFLGRLPYGWRYRLQKLQGLNRDGAGARRMSILVENRKAISLRTIGSFSCGRVSA
jgi:hypothetical protein